MYALFTLLAGACQSAMASLNGMLTDHIGMFGMSFCVHAIGGILLILYMKATTHERLKISGMPWYLYSAGFFGIFLVVSSSYCIGVLGVSFMTCISVTGQLVISAVIDHFGWFGVPKIPFNRKRLPCFILILAGLIILNLS
ncbi:MAG TPA: DMT family transporter [Candidatus Blautia excrementipullorum]|nr:DMT family transporter [Candidatus Blautia excrementipullorum]